MTVMNTKSRAPAFIGLAALLIFVVALLHNQRNSLPSVNADSLWHFDKTKWSGSSKDSSTTGERSFYDIARGYGTDKVTSHHYHDMYELHLPSRRHKKIKMLEIGLGCDMIYGPGASYNLWLDYFSNVDLYFIEYDAKCAAQWAHKTDRATVVTGDQADVAFLEKFLADHGRDFDIIIDDGGHTMTQQKNSLETLWKAVKPGGVYFIEDLQTSYLENYEGGDVAKKAGKSNMMEYIFHLREDWTWGPRRESFVDVETLYHIDCSEEVCGLFKRALSAA